MFCSFVSQKTIIMKTLFTLSLLLSFGLEFNSALAQGCTTMELETSGITVCLGGEVILDASAASGEDVMWDGGIFDGVAFTPAEIGIFIYTATTIDDSDCPLEVEITVNPVPTVIPGAGDENFCEDETVVLSAAGDADSYSWEPLDFSPGVGTHTYTLTGDYDIGCTNSATIEITVHAFPEIIASVDIDLTCIGNDVVFTASGADTYAWEDPAIENGEPYTTTMPGIITYIVSGTDINGCVGTGSVDLEIADAIEITGTAYDEVEGNDGGVDILFTGGVPAYSVDWDNDETGDFDDPANISGLAGGTYTVIVNGSLGCSGMATFTVNSQLNTTAFENTLLSVYPNPTADFVTLDLAGNFNYQLLTSKSNVVLTGNGFNTKTVAMESLPAGIYFFNIQSNAENKTIRVIKN
jgi:hypothetical protein